MTQWWRLLYDAGHKPVTRWLCDFKWNGNKKFCWGKDHLNRDVYWSLESSWLIQEIGELPPKQQREREEALEAVGDG